MVILKGLLTRTESGMNGGNLVRFTIYKYIYICVLHSIFPWSFFIIEKKPIHSHMHTLVCLSFFFICFALFLSGLERNRFEIPWLAGTHATAYAMSPPAGREKVELELSHLSSRGFAC